MRDIIEFLERELNNSIDNLSELKTCINNAQIDIDTAKSYSNNINADRDTTIDFFMSDAAGDEFRNNEIESLDREVDMLNKKLTDYNRKYSEEQNRLSDIKELINKYGSDSVSDYMDFSSRRDSYIDSFIDDMNSRADRFRDFLCDEILDMLQIILNQNNLVASLLTSDVSRAALELQNTNKLTVQIINSISDFSYEFLAYDSSNGFENTFNEICRRLSVDDRFSYQFVDEYNLCPKFNEHKSEVYLRLFTALLGFLNSVSRETYEIKFTNQKTKSKLTVTLDEQYSYIKDLLSNKDDSVRVINYYFKVLGSFIRFKNTKNKFVLEIDNNLYGL